MRFPYKDTWLIILVNNTLLNCFVLEQSIFKTKQLGRVLLNLLVLDKFLNGLGFRLQLQKSFQPSVFDLNWIAIVHSRKQCNVLHYCDVSLLGYDWV